MADNEDTKDMAARPSAAPVVAVAPAAKAPEAAKPIEAKLAAVTPVSAAPALAAEAPKPVVSAPAKAAASAKSAPAEKVDAAKPLAKPPARKAAQVKAKPVAKVAPKIKAAALVKTKPVEKVVPVKVAPTKPVSKVAKDVKAPVAAPAVPKAATPNAAPKTAPETKPVFAGLFTNFMLEERTMDMSTNFAGLQDAMTEAQAKAKAAFEKGTSVLGEVSEFTKGNVEACVESGKIFAEGVQGFGSELVSEGRTAFETMTGDIKELAAAKSPTDFFKIQGDMVRKNFDSAVAYSSKNSEAMLKLFSDSFAPISGRMSIAMEKARSASF